MARKNTLRTGLTPFLMALGLAALGQALVWRSEFWLGRSLSPYVWPQVFGWLAFACGGLLLKKSWRDSDGDMEALHKAKSFSRGWEALVLLALLALALFVRLYDIKNYPTAGFRDEGENGNVAIQIMNGEVVEGTSTLYPVYIEQNTQNATGYFYPTALFFKMFGISITSERYVSVFFGVLSVAAFYFMARWMFGVPLGIFLAACLSVLRWHMNFSRIGFLGIMTLCLEIPVFYFLLRGLKENLGPALKKFHPGLFGLAVALTVLRGFLSFVPALAGIQNILGLAMGLPFLIYAWKARKDPRSRTLMLAAFALALAMYSYIAARLLVIIVAAVLLRAFLGAKGAVDGKMAGRMKGLFWLTCLGSALLVGGSAQAAASVKGFGKILLALSFLAFGWMLFKRRSIFKGWLQPLALALGLGLVVAGPLYGYTLAHWQEINARSDRVSIYNDKEYDKRPWGAKLMEEIPLTLGMVNVRGDGNPRHNLPGEIMLNPLWAACFGLAIFYCLLQYKDERAWLALLWWQISLLAGYFSIEAPQAYRTIGAIPAIFIGIGLVLERGLVAARRAKAQGWDKVAVPGLTLLFGLGAFYEVQTYFQRQSVHPGVWAEFSTGEYMMGQELKKLQATGPTRGLVRADWSDSYTFRFATYPERNYEYFDLSRQIPLRDALPGQRYLYLLGPSQQPLAAMLKSYYPHGSYHEEKHKITGEQLYWSYLIGPEDIAAGARQHGGLKAFYFQDTPTDMSKPEAGPHWVKAGLRKEQVDPFLLFDWPVSPVPGFFSVEWRGALKVAVSGRYTFWVNSNSYGLLEIDGQKVCEQPFLPAERPPKQASVTLGAGRHDIRIRYFEARNYSRMELWWQQPGGEKEVLPSQALVSE